MKNWQKTPTAPVQIRKEMELPVAQPNFLSFECIYGPHKADLLHRGTAYCRTHYDERNRQAQLIN